ncbi:hypothetical protein [Methylomonas sp. YC3]
MSPLWRIIGLGVIAVLVFDTTASFAALAVGFPYAYASIGSFVIYTLVGYFAFRRCGLFRAIGAAVLVELVDATLGWFISWQIGPGALPEDQVTTSIVATTLVLVLVFAVACSIIGSTVARVAHGPRQKTNA